MRLEGCISGKTGTYGTPSALFHTQKFQFFMKCSDIWVIFVTYESIGGRCLFNVVDNEVKSGLTGRGISVLIVVQNRFLGLEELLDRLS